MPTTARSEITSVFFARIISDRPPSFDVTAGQRQRTLASCAVCETSPFLRRPTVGLSLSIRAVFPACYRCTVGARPRPRWIEAPQYQEIVENRATTDRK